MALAGILLLGAALRLNEYLANRPFWIDELMLALNVGRRSVAGLLHRLDYEQAAPVLFLLGLKLSSAVAGMSEPALRAIPLLSGLLLPLALWLLGRSLAGPAVGLGAAALAATAVPLIYYSGEVKPYGTDALVTAVLLWLAWRTIAAPERPVRWIVLGACGLVGLLLSLPAPFALAGAAAALLATPRVRAMGRRLIPLLAVWGLAVLLLEETVFRAGAANAYLDAFWRGTFLDLRSPGGAQRLFGFGAALGYPLGPLARVLPLSALAILLAAGGWVLFRRAGWPGALLIGVPFLALLVTVALGRYPVSGRLFLTLAPATYLLVATALRALLGLARWPEELLGPVAVLLVCVATAGEVIANGRAPVVRERGREAARWILRSEGDPVYVLASSLPAWAFYTTDWRQPDRGRLDRYAHWARGDGPAAPNDLLPVPPADSSLDEVLRVRGRLELVGFRSGLRYREPAGIAPEEPPATWARREARRIAAEARPYVWLYGAHWAFREVPVLRAELYRLGLRVVEEMQEEGGVALRWRSGRNAPP